MTHLVPGTDVAPMFHTLKEVVKLSLLRALGSYMAKMGSNKELMTGIMEGLRRNNPD